MQMTVYFKYPYILYESAIPIFLYAYLMNPLDLEWYWNNVSLALAWSGIVLFNNPLAILFTNTVLPRCYQEFCLKKLNSSRFFIETPL